MEVEGGKGRETLNERKKGNLHLLCNYSIHIVIPGGLMTYYLYKFSIVNEIQTKRGKMCVYVWVIHPSSPRIAPHFKV